MKNPERRLGEEQEIHFAQKFIETLQERLINDPDFQKACTEKVLFSPTTPGESGFREIIFKRSNGIEFRVSMDRDVSGDMIHVTRYSGVRDGEGNFTDEGIWVKVSYDLEFKGACTAWGGERGKPNSGLVQYSKWSPKKEPPYVTSDLEAIRETGRFIRENFPNQES